MASFAPWAAALAGFRLVRQRPLAVLTWSAVIFVGRLIGLALTTAMSGRYMPALDAAVNAKTIDPQAVAQAYQPVAPGYLAGALVAMPFVAIVTAAIYRAYLRPEEGRWCFLKRELHRWYAVDALTRPPRSDGSPGAPGSEGAAGAPAPLPEAWPSWRRFRDERLKK